MNATGYSVTAHGITVDIHPNGTLSIYGANGEQVTMGVQAADTLARALAMTAGIRASNIRRRLKAAYAERYGEVEL